MKMNLETLDIIINYFIIIPLFFYAVILTHRNRKLSNELKQYKLQELEDKKQFIKLLEEIDNQENN